MFAESVAGFGAGNTTSPDRPRDLREAAQAFEGLLLANLLKSARAEDSDAEQQDGATMREFAEEHLARQIAQGGGLGFARMIEVQMLSSRLDVPAAIETGPGSG